MKTSIFCGDDNGKITHTHTTAHWRSSKILFNWWLIKKLIIPIKRIYHSTIPSTNGMKTFAKTTVRKLVVQFRCWMCAWLHQLRTLPGFNRSWGFCFLFFFWCIPSSGDTCTKTKIWNTTKNKNINQFNIFHSPVNAPERTNMYKNMWMEC